MAEASHHKPASAPAEGNRLGSETSPYLLQHRDNPVAWRPWGKAAFAEARAESKPVLLSVGYAACHWCHVMAHECFEDSDIAEAMNRLFVNIKVDREERPDVDSIYQAALALLGQQGGWPLTMFLTPDGEPFWGGTYFPPEPRYGRPGLPQVLQAVAEIYANDKGRVEKNTTALKDALGELSQNVPGGAISLEALDQVALHLLQKVDPREGGFGGAPKFPQPALLELFWRAWKRGGDDALRHATELTMTKMCEGGIYDHLGGGFARYTVDGQWLVPHFEKMLYDNAQLVEVLTWLWQDTRKPLYEQRLRETIDWVLREMIAHRDASGPEPSSPEPTGAFAATLDADSEGEEGKFYVWSEAEIDALLGGDAPLFKAHYDVRPQGNWEGKTILNRSARTRQQEEPAPDPATEERLAFCREILFAARAKRVWPGWDDKVLADWNGLMIAALSEAALACDEPVWLGAAEEAFAFVCREMQRDGRLHHAWRHGQLKHPATLDDYANMAAAALALLEATGRPDYLAQAQAWVALLDRHYWDDGSGGYFLTADDTPDLIVRTKTAYDSAVPAGNGTMLGVLARLYHLTGKVAYRERADSLATAFSGELARNIFPLATLLNAAELLISAQQVVIVGERGAPATDALLRCVTERCLPNRVLQVFAPADPLPAGHPAAGKGQVDGRATAYLCHGTACSLPMTEPAKLAAALDAGVRRP